MSDRPDKVRSILFVDDEPRILQGLKRMLRGRRHAWDMEFAEGGKAAMERLASRSFDVIVSDMRMPEIDGATLLAHVKETYPGMVRIVLSGHTEQEAALRTVSVAHQFLAKPCDSDTIENVVERACALQDLLGSDELKRVIGEVDTLPPLPRIYQRLTAALAAPEPAMDEVAEIVHQDVGITAKLLQLVNSSFFGLARRVTDVRQACVYLGMNMLKSLVLSVEVFGHLRPDGRASDFDQEEEHHHAMLTATLAASIAEGDKQHKEDAYLAGMMHDVGRLVLAARLPDAYGKIREAQDPSRSLHDVELEVLGVTHAEIGAYLLGIWGMPCPVAESVANHHQPDRFGAAGLDLCTAIHVADALAHERRTRTQESAAPMLDEAHLSSIGCLDRVPRWREIASRECERIYEGAGAR